MKKNSILICVAMTMAAVAYADIHVNVPESYLGKEFRTVVSPIEDLSKVYRTGVQEEDSLMISSTTFTLPSPKVPSQIMIYTNDARFDDVYVGPDDNVTLTFGEDNKLQASGTTLLEEIVGLSQRLLDLRKAFFAAYAAGDAATMEAIDKQYETTIKSYVEQNPDSDGAVFAVMEFKDQELIDYADKLGDKAKESMIYPLLMRYVEVTKMTMDAKNRQCTMVYNVEAPNFTLPGLDGKDVSLSDFRGKWVILDFWGSWCGWCIKGMPRMKEAYEQYKDKLEIVGVDCNDSDEAWRAAVAKYKLPWVHVYNNQDSIYQAYGVQGFPTKVIIDPEGKIYKIVVGEDPKFYDILAELMAK
jgi:thiol-disulfide isomerase/thioredoxin